MKRRNVTRLLALTLSFVMVLSMAACGKKEETSVPQETAKTEETPATEAEGETAEADPFAEKITISKLGYYTSNVMVSADSYAEKLLEEKFNVDLVPVTDVNRENYGTFEASGDVLDVNAVCVYMFNSDMQRLQEMYYDEELIRSFPEEWLWEYYPTGMQYLVDGIGQDWFDDGAHLVNGECLYVPFEDPMTAGWTSPMYRKDWAENLGISEPTTLDEFHDMLYAFTYDDPDGNGKDDTYGLGAYQNSWLSYIVALGAFGLQWPTEYRLAEDGSVEWQGATEAYRSALGIIKEWYDEGIIDPECLTLDRSGARAKWADNKIGCVVEQAVWNWSTTAGNVKGMVEAVAGEGSTDVLGTLTTEYGDGTVYFCKDYPSLIRNGAVVFTADTTDEQIIRYLQILEGLSSDVELHKAIAYGIEGEDYTMENGVISIPEEVTVEYKAERGLGTTYWGAALNKDLDNLTLSAADIAMNEKMSKNPMLFFSGGATFNVNGTNEAHAQKNAEVKKITEEYFANILLGQDNLDAGWDAYIEKLNKAGLEEIIAEYEALLAN